MLVKKNDETWKSHMSRLERHHTGSKGRDLSYRVVHRLLDAVDYGAPQHRHRVFLVGFRSDLKKEWSFPELTHSFDQLLWDQWISGEYCDEHRVPRKPDLKCQYGFRHGFAASNQNSP